MGNESVLGRIHELVSEEHRLRRRRAARANGQDADDEPRAVCGVEGHLR